MTIEYTFNIGDLFAGIVSIVAILAATIVGVSQTKINRKMLKIQDHYDLFIRVVPTTTNDAPDQKNIVPKIGIQNLSSTIVYLENYSFNGRVYSVTQAPLPPVTCITDYIYLINLPQNGQTHVSFEIHYIDSLNRRWMIDGYFDFDVVWMWNLNRAKRI